MKQKWTTKDRILWLVAMLVLVVLSSSVIWVPWLGYSLLTSEEEKDRDRAFTRKAVETLYLEPLGLK